MNTKTVYTKITPDHLRRQALVSIRQSTTQQVRSNHESVERQYALVERAVALGWGSCPSSVRVNTRGLPSDRHESKKT